MKPNKVYIEVGARAVKLAFSELKTRLIMTDQCASGLAGVVLQAVIAECQILEEDAGSPEHPVALLHLDRE